MSLKKYKITLTKFIDDSDLEFEEKKILDIIKPDSFSIKKEDYNIVETLDTFLSQYTQGWIKLSNNHWTKKKEKNIEFDIYLNNEKWNWKVKHNNIGIDSTIIERGIADSYESAIKLCDNAIINYRIKTF
jgi:light-regulated signal transduction histidine kinase (bacteriophytochrome)